MCISFLQAEDGIRYGHVTGVQTCALPILSMVALLPPELDNAWVKLFGGLLDHKPTHIPLTHHLHAVLLGQHLTLFASSVALLLRGSIMRKWGYPLWRTVLRI